MLKLDEEEEGESRVIAVRLPESLYAVISAERGRIQADVPGSPASDSQALRAILARVERLASRR